MLFSLTILLLKLIIIPFTLPLIVSNSLISPPTSVNTALSFYDWVFIGSTNLINSLASLSAAEIASASVILKGKFVAGLKFWYLGNP